MNNSRRPKNYSDSEIEEFFDKLFKIKEHDNKRYDISNILYQIGKNEV